MFSTDREHSSGDEGSFFIDSEIGRARSDIDDDDSKFLLSLGEGSLSDSEYIWVDIHDLDTDIEDSLFDIGEDIGSDRYDMTTDFEFFATHPDRILDTTFEIKPEALWYYLEYSTIHGVETILTHIERSIDILFCDFYTSHWDDRPTRCDVDVDP
jgi:hypothetical protein